MSCRNKTLTLTPEEIDFFAKKAIKKPSAPLTKEAVLNKVIWGKTTDVLPLLPENSVDLLITDPPYNLTKTYSKSSFYKQDKAEYEAFLDSWISLLKRVLKKNASLYICIDWTASSLVEKVTSSYFKVRNRITWEREKGRGALQNWKNCSEDIWFFTNSDEYTFNLDNVKLKKKVLAPYRDEKGHPKDWDKEKFRLTAPSNLWTDISVPFWSMAENTPHPTQKPEKLIAKLILASSNPKDVVLDCFLGSGTTSVVAKKLNRDYIGIEQEKEYVAFAQKRLNIAEEKKTIQGYEDGFFWERNTQAFRKKQKKDIKK
ncbi:MAG: site-specific DNA-methyltransferase [Alphaproteobacteria bacterium]|nr:site-specific DNA-methyltransferase [Alphaproteobacteria bacterium]